jgi:molybdate transport system substrate-binding protein
MIDSTDTRTRLQTAMWRLLLGSLIIVLASIGVVNIESCSSENESEDDGSITLLVSAASSLTDLFEALRDSFQLRHPDVSVQLNLAGSNLLVRQIQEGAPVDVLAVADLQVVQPLVDAGDLQESDLRVFATNRVCVVVPTASHVHPGSVDDLAGAQYHAVAIASNGVPVRRYSEEILRNAGLWNRLANRFVFGANVRQVLAYVESGEADCGFVYVSDTVVSDRVRTGFIVPDSLHSPIRYPVAVLHGGPRSHVAETFVAFVTDTARREDLARFGFAMPAR